MERIKEILNTWRKQRVEKIEMSSVFSRNPTAHKWKATYRCLVIRELVFWRIIDLLDQMVTLANNNGVLGARILLRSAFETLGILIFLNQKINALLDGSLAFDEFSSTTVRLILGTKTTGSKIQSINIVTILQKNDQQYPGIFGVYKTLSESSHPNFEGMYLGYSEIDEKNYITYFKNRWDEMYSNELEDLALLCINTFEIEYNDIWPELFEKLENWLEDNDDQLSTD